MIVRNSSLIYRLAMLVPFCLSPYTITPARIGLSLDLVSEIRWKWSRND